MTFYLIRNKATGDLWSQGRWCRSGRAYTRRCDCKSALHGILRHHPTDEVDILVFDNMEPTRTQTAAEFNGSQA